jgi:signal transduction histidine kinase
VNGGGRRLSVNTARTPSTEVGGHGRECVLAAGRAFFAVGALASLYFADLPAASETLVVALAAAYFAYTLVLLLWARHRVLSRAAILGVHLADILWPVLFSVFVDSHTSFFLLCLFALLAGAYRWGFRESVGTAVVLVLLSEPARLLCGQGRLAYCAPGGFPFRDWATWAASVIAAAVALGYLAQQEARLRRRALVAERIVTGARPDAATRDVVEGVVGALAKLFGSPRVLLAVQEAATEKTFVWQGSVSGPLEFTLAEGCESRQYFGELMPSSDFALYLRKSTTGRISPLLGFDGKGKGLPRGSIRYPAKPLGDQAFRTALVVAFPVGEESAGRLFLFDPAAGSGYGSDLRLLQELIRDVVPALHSVYLLRRLRARAQAAERKRVARELHDTVIQSLVAAEMEVEVLRRRGAAPAGPNGEIHRVQLLLREGVRNLRDLMERSKTFEVRPSELVGAMEEIVEKFRCETGISARFASETGPVALPPRVCGELARIVQEALVNVRKHSRAHQVLVRFAMEQGIWKLVVEDDGRGSGFEGRLTQVELDLTRKGPAIIKERARSIGAEMMLESRPGRGTHLEICLPQNGYG